MKYFALLCLIGGVITAPLTDNMQSEYDSATLKPVAAAAAQLRASAAVALAPEAATITSTITATTLNVANKEAAENSVNNKDVNPLETAADESLISSRSPMKFDRVVRYAPDITALKNAAENLFRTAIEGRYYLAASVIVNCKNAKGHAEPDVIRNDAATSHSLVTNIVVNCK